MAKRAAIPPGHTGTGNCLAVAKGRCRKCGTGENCDVCHEHEEPRGDCSECEPCAGCKEENADD